jgi:hypothetical protein
VRDCSHFAAIGLARRAMSANYDDLDE